MTAGDYARAYSSHSPGQHSGSGSARLDLSQKGDLPSSGERVILIWSKVAGARKRGNGVFKIIYKDKQGDDLEEMTK